MVQRKFNKESYNFKGIRCLFKAGIMPRTQRESNYLASRDRLLRRSTDRWSSNLAQIFQGIAYCDPKYGCPSGITNFHAARKLFVEYYVARKSGANQSL
jgi:hypothetical protein